MINQKVTRQEGGDGSMNIQGQSITINHGITYQDARTIALDVFKNNFLELSTIAQSVAKERAEALIDEFLNQLQSRKPDGLNSMNDPGMLHAIFTAQKEYAKSGDKELSDMLVDILVDRSNQEQRNLRQIVLDESLSIVSKLTLDQLDTLSIIFLLRYSISKAINSFESLKDYLSKYFPPFISNLSKNSSLYQHLEYAGCGTISMASNSIEGYYSERYKALFCTGFTQQQFEEKGLNLDKYSDILMVCMKDESKFQFVALNDDLFEELLLPKKLDHDEKTKVLTFFNNYQMKRMEVKEILLSQGEFMNKLFDVWENSSIKEMTLTSVGIAIAIANIRRKTSITIDLGIWIK